mgnify:CR=1 FL=1
MKKRNYLSDVEDRSGNAFSVIADFEGNEEQLMDIEVEEVLPILPLRNMVLFPGVFMPVSEENLPSNWCVKQKRKILI